MPPRRSGASAGGAAARPSASRRRSVRARGRTNPSSVGGSGSAGTTPLAAGIFGLLAAALLALAALISGPVLVVVALLIQLPLVGGWLVVVGAPGAGGGALIGVGAALAADIALLVDRSNPVADLAGILGVSVLVALAHQLGRRERERLTASLAASLSAVMLVAALALLVALRGGHGGQQAVADAMFALAGAVLTGRLADTALANTQIVAGSRRGPLGLLLGLLGATAVGAAYGSGAAPLDAGSGAVLGAVVGVAAAAADLASAVAIAGLAPTPARPDRRRIAMLAVSALLPVVAAAPVAYVTGRVLVG